MSNHTKETPTIFLDIDGVMWCHETIKQFGDKQLDRRDQYGKLFPDVHVEALANIVKYTGAVIVISSTWRKFKDVEKMWLDRGYCGEISGYTPIIEDAPRGWEIRSWLKIHRPKNFDRYVILDDDSDMLYTQRLNFCHVNGTRGLIGEHVGKAVSMLTRKTVYHCFECGSTQLNVERSSGYLGYRCGDCGQWNYNDKCVFRPPTRV
jgi:DNA-directed RNA polymerase subunit RPC12/RpoP